MNQEILYIYFRNKECFATSNLNKQQTIVAFLNKNRDLCDKLIN